MSKLSSSSNDEFVYYNINVTNNTSGNINATYAENRTQPLLEKCDDYALTIVRFSIDGSAIPLFYFPDYQFYVTLSYGGNDYSTLLVSPKSNIYSYQEFVNIINVGLTSSFNALKLANPAVTSTEAPYTIYNRDTKTIDIIVQKSYVADNITLWYNYPLYSFFESYDCVFANNFSNQIKAVNIFIKDLKNNSYDLTHYIMPQEFSTLFAWVRYNKIVFTSNLIPVRTEGIASRNGTGNVTNFNILTDFELDRDLNPRSVLQYNNNTEFRYTNLVSNGALRNIDFNIYLQDDKNDIKPLQIAPTKSYSIKLLFRKKDSIPKLKFD